ncbi:hypothetical protein M3G91_08415 [Micromonospora chalcea]|uniref:hypothetical protein n=1 Tax=Micromonospora chalcea TaxID=1874 RepID=UPI0021A3B37E|nr:hypothetical protein [Micromonospora chalcea]MCT2277644.1 hypothetical protein [Micromonospora chalcea]
MWATQRPTTAAGATDAGRSTTASGSGAVVVTATARRRPAAAGTIGAPAAPGRVT